MVISNTYEVGQQVLGRAVNRKDWNPATIMRVPGNQEDPKAVYWLQFPDYAKPVIRVKSEIKPVGADSAG